MSISNGKRYLVGYALASKKEQSFIQPSLIDRAKQRGIDLIKLDPQKPLSEQGDLDCIIHKLYGGEWEQRLQDFRSKYPNVPVIDPIESIKTLHNRVSMLDVVSRLTVPQGNERFDVPNQIVVSESSVLESDGAIGELRYPVIAKPVKADGSAKSHKMYLVFDQEGLKVLKAPIVIQEFVNHGGVIFKVYVAGQYVKCVKRRSLPDVTEDKIGSLKGSLSFSQISNLTAQAKSHKCNDSFDIMNLDKADLPPLSFVIQLARGLREAMGLNLFNFDVIRDARDLDRYLIIDINYFPGYAKMPSYESVLTDFLWDVVHHNNFQRADCSIVVNNEDGVGNIQENV